ncbi:MAG: arylamine N-acetyltransferase [Pseudomonadales bacterium]|jgi:N-hydroxyarylamine O-acetyltransferase|nr:arylamine N-acetyltransferase [Pseudomonadales bacterium]MDP6472522.1 arylamine N-acetyltransferase [Pseudomonadales bacterium]MDP6828667.1 arylamine N-acetyltransferase [Pseudomonadales bacterium]MDP6971987.1 arylamine N-acetyltransferase [Pseudomonadales bacterium]|tara:strand:+ start:854 stop:1648 length:795 start_codon:yes stop_codon:yes gene_type:complete
MHFDEDAYLARTGAARPQGCTLEALTQLSQAQAFAVPFENFDILLGRGIDVAPEAIFEKLVDRGRGGYCFELNGLFLQALQHFGFEARALLARVHVSGQVGGRTHQVSLVHLDGEPWVVDVGFGAFTQRYPMPLNHKGETQQHDDLRFRYVDCDPWGVILQAQKPDGWQNLYSFDLETVCRGDIETGNHFTSTSPRALFTMMRIATMLNKRGRNTLSDLQLTRVADGEERLETVEDGPAYLALLDQLFGLDLGASSSDLPPIRG